MNRIDALSPYAPPLAGYGPLPIGVTADEVVLEDQPDIFVPSEAGARRVLSCERWYPALAGTVPGGTYDTLLRCGTRRAVLHGRAARDAAAQAGAWPLVVISHGYPGSRHLMVHLAETLASRGFVVMACDHPGSVYDDPRAFGETLLHRPLDQVGLIDALVARADEIGIDDTRVGLIGYSMGGYGALISGGAGLAPGAVDFERAPPARMLARHVRGGAAHRALARDALRAVVAIGPWGGLYGMWDAQGLAGMRVPVLTLAGTRDDVSGYAAMRGLHDGMTGVARRLVRFDGAGHNAAAPHPAPAESHAMSDALGWAPFAHYADPVWDTVRMNNIAQHFVADFLGMHLAGSAPAELPVIEGVAVMDAGGGL
ncbi:alpha/beta fold hydrolase [Sulfitobacter albidus]|uniref:Alpha/beta fold hydrolase n=1 Tax=Sulfitobacter albidus TaxID=2829501 RepID=A0A975PN49_9RHOB|nr:alpha/beta fold hydrolase [Sulfitobacter albidus]QUJ77091.1 alpha/beta fold hydrolase [Sulfitobacter albidus]